MYGRRATWWQLRNACWLFGLDFQMRWKLFFRRLFPGRKIALVTNQPKHQKFKLIVLSFMLLLLLLVSWVFYSLETSIEPVLSRVAEIRARQIAVETINKVITEKIVDNIEYQQLMIIHKDGQNRPVLIQPNLIKIEKLQATAALEINEALKNLADQKFSIPLGVVTGSKLLAATGPDLDVSVLPMGTVDLVTINEFKQAGINQTRHILSLRVTTEITVVIPFVDCQTKVTTVVPVADNIIIGPVPSVLMNMNAK